MSKTYEVTFTRYYTYTVTAEDEDEAIDKAEKEFSQDNHSAVAVTWYDESEVECQDDEDEEECDEEECE